MYQHLSSSFGLCANPTHQSLPTELGMGWLQVEDVTQSASCFPESGAVPATSIWLLARLTRHGKSLRLYFLTGSVNL